MRLGGGATLMTPRNGDSGSSMPPGNNATLRCGSVLTIRGVGTATRAGDTPEPGSLRRQQYGTRFRGVTPPGGGANAQNPPDPPAAQGCVIAPRPPAAAVAGPPRQ